MGRERSRREIKERCDYICKQIFADQAKKVAMDLSSRSRLVRCTK